MTDCGSGHRDPRVRSACAAATSDIDDQATRQFDATAWRVLCLRVISLVLCLRASSDGVPLCLVPARVGGSMGYRGGTGGALPRKGPNREREVCRPTPISSGAAVGAPAARSIFRPLAGAVEVTGIFFGGGGG